MLRSGERTIGLCCPRYRRHYPDLIRTPLCSITCAVEKNTGGKEVCATSSLMRRPV